MNDDSYCIALFVLVAFLLYLDNQRNIEPFGAFGDAGAPLSDVGSDKVVHEEVKQVIQDDQEKYVPIGLKPQKLSMQPPSSMSSSMDMLSGAPADLQDYMLLPLDVIQGSKTFDSRVPMPYPRVGGVGNVGKDLEQPHHGLGQEQAPQEQAQQEQAQASGNIAVDIVYAPWCGWSKKSLPDFEKMNEKLNNLSSNETNGWNVSCNLYDSETPDGKKKAKELDVKGFPTVLVNVNGKQEDGPRGYDEMIKYINEVTGSNISP